MHAKHCNGTDLRPDPTCKECQRWASANEERYNDAPTPPARETWRAVIVEGRWVVAVLPRRGPHRVLADVGTACNPDPAVNAGCRALAESIARDHNAVGAMREALCDLLNVLDYARGNVQGRGEPRRFLFGRKDRPNEHGAITKARAALALAGEE